MSSNYKYLLFSFSFSKVRIGGLAKTDESSRLTDVKPIFEQARTTLPARSSVEASALPQGDADADRQSTAQTMTEGTTWARAAQAGPQAATTGVEARDSLGRRGTIIT
jgi:hypothetical protein